MVRDLGLRAPGAGAGRRLAVALALLATLLAGALGTAGPAAAAGDRILIYAGNSSPMDGSSFTQFQQAVALPLDDPTTLPASLASYACVVLPGNTAAFDQGQVAQLAAYLAGGGRVIALGEGSDYPVPNATMNALVTALGVPLAIDPTGYGFTNTVTTNIDAVPLTAGVASVNYLYVSRVTVGAGGQSLVRTADTNEPFIAAAPMGAGTFVLTGEYNAFGDNIGYTQNDNGVLARNLCLGVAPVLSQVRGTMTYGDTTGSVTARLTTTGGAPLPGATVAFTVNGTPAGSATTNAQGVASKGGVAFPAGLNAGTYQNIQVCATFAGDANYLATGPTCGPLVVARRVLTVKPVDRTVGLKQPNPPTTPPAGCAPTGCWLELVSGSTFVNGDTWAALNFTNLRFQYSRNPAATNATEQVGSAYRITALGAASSNYELRYQTGTLRVVQATP